MSGAPEARPSRGFWSGLFVLAGLASWLPLSALAGLFGCRPASDNLGIGALLAATATAIVLAAVHAGAEGWGRSILVGFAGGFVVFVVATGLAGNMFGATERGKQKRTMGDMRTYAAVIEAMAQGTGRYPEGLTAIDLGSQLGKRDPILRDAWGTPLDIHVRANRYVIRSAGLCGAFETGDPWASARGPTGEWRADIVLDTGEFTAYPEGAQE